MTIFKPLPTPADDAPRERPRTARELAAAWATLLALVALMVISFLPPSVVPASAPPQEASAERAMAHVHEIARAPHPTGSAENQRVREYLLAQLTALGLEAEVQSTIATRTTGPQSIATAQVHNVVGRLEGNHFIDGATTTILLMAHYDSVPTGPGASDDAAGVAAILEALRALRAGPGLHNSIIVLFTDGEEAGLLGAQAFFDQHRWMAEVGVAINFEARGGGGPALLFETSAENGWIVEQAAEAGPDLTTSSLLASLYEQMPNDTDLTVLKAAPIDALNFAYADSWPVYHSGRDRPEVLDQRSLQHHASTALALVRQLESIALEHSLDKADLIFFNIGPLVARYPQRWALPLAILGAALLLAAIVRGVRGKYMRIKGVLGGLGATLAGIAFGALVPLMALLGVQLLMGGRLINFDGTTYRLHLFALGFVALEVAVALAIYQRVRPLLSAAELTAGALAGWAALALWMAGSLPGGSYLLTWPLIAGAAALLGPQPEGWRWQAAALLPAAAAAVVLTPLSQLLLMMLGAPALPALGAIIALALAPAMPALLPERSTWRWPTGLALAACLGLAGLALTHGHSAAQPQLSSLFFAQDADADTAHWVSLDQTADPWAAQYLGPTAQTGVLSDYLRLPAAAPVMAAPAEALPLQPPELEVLGDVTEGTTRTVRLRLSSPRGARQIIATMLSETVVYSSTVNGHHSPGDPAAPSFWTLNATAPPPAGIEVTLALRAGDELAIGLLDLSPGLPPHPTAPAARPADSTSTIDIDSTTIVGRRVLVE